MSFFAELKRRNVLRVAVAYLVLSWLAVQVASVLLPTFQAPAWVMRVMVLVLAVGFVATLVASWVYELTPEGLKRESEVDRSESITHRTARKLDIAVIVLLVAAIAAAVLTRGGGPVAGIASRPGAVAGDLRPSVAVLPFVNMSALAENEYFADGLSETLLNMLAHVPGLKVAARTSAFAFKGKQTDIREIARTLDVQTVLEGSVQRAGTRVRITAQLIDARDGSHLWSESYDRNLDDIFAIQDEIARMVATELTRSLLGSGASAEPEIVSVETRNAKAYDLYLRALEQSNIISYGSLPRAESLFKQALALDPQFSDARIGLARTYFLMADTGLLGEPEAAQRSRGLLAPLLERSEPDPLAQSYDAILQLRAAQAAEETVAERHAQETTLRALGIAPNTIELYDLAAEALRWDDSKGAQALEIVERGLRLDPLSPTLLNAKARQLRALKRYDDALATYARLRELAPESPTGYNGAALVYGDRGPYVEAIRWYARGATIDREDHELPANAAQYLLTLGLPAEALPWIKRAELLNASGSDTRRVLIQYAEQAKDPERAIKLAADVIRERRDNRRWVYGIAVSVYVTLMYEAGKLDAALELLRTVSPGMVETPPKAPRTEFDEIIIWSATEFLAAGWSPAERSARVEHLITARRALDPDFDPEEGGEAVFFHALRGETERAAALLVPLLADPAELPWDWHTSVRSPALAEVMKDPRVVAAIAKLEADFAQQATRYRELVATGEIVVP